MKKRMYLIYLTNGEEYGGDEDIVLCEQPVWDWIHSPFDHEKAGGRYCYKETIPGTKKKVTITSGSFENDRAIHFSAYVTQHTDQPIFLTKSDARLWGKNRGYVISRQIYEGYIY